MPLTVGSGAGAKTVPKRRSLSERRAISRVNREREEKGKEKLSGTEDVSSAPGVSQQEKYAAAQKTVRQLNESAQRSGSSNFYALQENSRGEVEIVKRQESKRNFSTGVNKGGVQQIPGLQTQTSSQPKVEERFVPVASGRDTNPIFLDTQSGKTFSEVGTSKEGGTLFVSAEPQRNIGFQSRPQTERKGSELATPFLKVSPQRREQAQKAGEFFITGGAKIKEETAGASPIFRTAGKITGTSAQVLGGNLERFGYDPQSYVAGNVVLPATGGATITGVTAPLIARAPAVVQGVVASGTVVATGKAVAARPAEAQSPDVLFGLAGSVAGAKAGAFNPNPKSTSAYYANPVPGAPNRAARLGQSTANKPTSKAQLRKQSFNQNYNPANIQRDAYTKIKTPSETRITYDVKGKSKDLVVTRDVFTVQSSTAPGVSRKQGIQLKNKVSYTEPTKTFQQVSFKVPGGKVLQTSEIRGGRENVLSEKFVPRQNTDVSKAIQRNRIVEVKGNVQPKNVYTFRSQPGSVSDNLYGTGSVSIQQSKPVNVPNLGNLPVPKRFALQGEQRPDFGQYGRQLNRQPEYELSPNVKPQEYSQYAAERSSGRGRVYQDIVGRLRAKNAARTDFVIVETPPTSQGSLVPRAPVKDVSLNQRFSDVPSVASQPTGSSLYNAGSVPGVLGDTGVKPVTNTFTGASQNFRITPVFKQDNERQQVTAPALSVVQQEKKAVTPVVFQNQGVRDFTVISPRVTQNFRSATDSEVIQSSKSLQENVSATKFVFVAPPVPAAPVTPILQKPLVVPQPPKAPDRFRPTTPKPQPFRYGEQQRPTPPLRFGLGSSKRGEALYDVQVGSKGNKYFFDLGRGGNEVLTKARDIARGTAAASIRVTPLTRDASSRVDSLLGNDFVRNKSGVYVQKNALRISSAGEKAQIPGASKNRRLTKGEDYGRALKAVNRGFSLRGFRRGA